MSKQPDKKTSPPAQPAADERNLVSKRELDKALPPEERIKIWWDKNKTALAAGAILALLMVVGYQGIRLYRQAYETKVQQAWLEISTSADRTAFAGQYATHPLAGLALLQLGDEQYREGNFSEARHYYQKAAEVLIEPIFLGKARLGAAISAVKEGDRDTGKSILHSLAQNPEGFHSIRAEATYHRAILALEEEDIETMERQFDLLTTLRFAEGWLSRLQEVRAQTGH